MPDLNLSEREQKLLRALLANEPVPGTPIPTIDFLQRIGELVPADSMGACLAANSGPMLEELELPRGLAEALGLDLDPHAGPLFLGRMHWSRYPRAAAACAGILPGWVDGVCIGYRNGPDAVAQIWFDRENTPFSERDLALLDLLAPVLQRQLRQRPTPHLPASLTVQERRVLMEVAAGSSNAEIAATLFIAPSTVRKHLEHAYRKLGVHNRMAAVVAFGGAPQGRSEQAQLVDEYA